MMQIDWANTPGAYYAIAYWIGCWIVVLNGPRKLKWVQSAGVMTIFGLLLVTLMSVTHGAPPMLFVPFMILFFLIMWCTIYLVCIYDCKTSLYFTARAFIIGEFIASLEWEIFYYTLKLLHIEASYWINFLLIILVDGFLFLGMNYLEKKNHNVNKHLQITWQELFSASIITLAIFTVSNLTFVFRESGVENQYLTELFMIRTLVDLGGVAILYAYHTQLGELNMRYEMERLQAMLDMQYNNYEMLEKGIAMVNQKYHDLKYQIAVLKAETSGEKNLAYLDQMEREIKFFEAQNKTGNKVLDTILTGKMLQCQNNWIELTSVVDGEALDFMEEMDISTLFGNMLDNAIESVRKIEKKEKRLIHLAVAKQRGFLRIRVENCYEDSLEFENGLPTTTKKDRRYHGFGLKSIQNTVKKYGGSTTIHAENGWFELRILIPIK